MSSLVKFVNVEEVGEAIITRAGIGMFGGWWGQEMAQGVGGVEEGNVEGKAEIWFGKY